MGQKAMDEYEEARLKLALLKENFGYRKFFNWLSESPYERCTELRRPDDSDESFEKRTHAMEHSGAVFFCGVADDYDFNPYFILETQQRECKLLSPKHWRSSNEKIQMPYGEDELNPIPPDEVLTLLNPIKGLNDVNSEVLLAKLPELFISKSVSEITDDFVTQYLESFQRALVIDLSANKSTILKDLDDYITSQMVIKGVYDKWYGKGIVHVNSQSFRPLPDGEPANNERKAIPIPDDLLRFRNWDADKSRLRKERWDHLEVWKLRRKRIAFPEISESLSINEQTAKDRFYRAFELTQRRPYNPEYDHKEVWTYRITDIGKICKTCEERDQCTTLCPEMILYVEQDKMNSTRELLVGANDFYPDDEGD